MRASSRATRTPRAPTNRAPTAFEAKSPPLLTRCYSYPTATPHPLLPARCPPPPPPSLSSRPPPPHPPHPLRVRRYSLGAKLLTEAVGVAFLILALMSTAAPAAGVESFGTAAPAADGAASAPAISARRHLAFNWWSGTDAKTAAVGLDDGLLYVAITYMTAYISGAHLNPAVSLGHALVGSMSQDEAGMYALVQTLTACLASLAGGYLYEIPAVGTTAISDLRFAVGTLLFGFALVLVHLVVMRDRLAGHEYHGIAIGFTLFAGILSFGDAETACFNPAAAIGLWLAQGLLGTGFDFATTSLLDVSVVVVTPFAAAALALVAYRLMEIKATNAGAPLALCTLPSLGTSHPSPQRPASLSQACRKPFASCRPAVGKASARPPQDDHCTRPLASSPHAFHVRAKRQASSPPRPSAPSS